MKWTRYTYLKFGQKIQKNLAAIKQKGCLLPTCSFPLQKKGNYFILTLDRLSDLPHAHCISTTFTNCISLSKPLDKTYVRFFLGMYLCSRCLCKKPFYSANKKNSSYLSNAIGRSARSSKRCIRRIASFRHL